MINSLYIAETGLNAQKTLVDVISNNIANVNTAGYKKAKVDFVDLIYKDENSTENVSSASNTLQYRGVHVSSVSQDLSPGKLKYTEHPFDVAIQGEGFFALNIGDNQTGYTRVGRLGVDSEGYLTSAQGYRLESNIAIPPDLDGVVVTKTGEVRGVVNGSSDMIELGQLELFRFGNPQGLSSIGEGLFLQTEDAGTRISGLPSDEGFGALLQGYTEESNVSMVEEMVNLVIAQRGYQLNARVIQVSDQLLETINNLRR